MKINRRIVIVLKSTLMSCGLFLGIYSQGFAQVIYDSETPECEVPEDGILISSILESATNRDDAQGILESAERIYIATEDFSNNTRALNSILAKERLPVVVVSQHSSIAAGLTAGWVEGAKDKICKFFKRFHKPIIAIPILIFPDWTDLVTEPQVAQAPIIPWCEIPEDEMQAIQQRMDNIINDPNLATDDKLLQLCTLLRYVDGFHGMCVSFFPVSRWPTLSFCFPRE